MTDANTKHALPVGKFFYWARFGAKIAPAARLAGLSLCDTPG